MKKRTSKRKPRSHKPWEMAYERWFFLRFILLLIALALSIALACIFFGSIAAPEDDSTYEPPRHIIEARDAKRLAVYATSTTDKPGTTAFVNNQYHFKFLYPDSYSVRKPINSHVPAVLDRQITEGVLSLTIDTNIPTDLCFTDDDGLPLSDPFMINGQQFYFFETANKDSVPYSGLQTYRTIKNDTCFDIVIGGEGSESEVQAAIKKLRESVRSFTFTTK